MTILDESITDIKIAFKVYSEYSDKGLLEQPILNLDEAFAKRVGENRLATSFGLLEALLKLHLFLPSKHVLILG